MNKFIGIGRLTKELELRQTNSGKNVLSNSIAIKNDFKNADGEYGSEFVNVQFWGKTAEYLVQYAQKGMLISIEGRLTTRNYDDADGNKKYVTEVICNSVELLEKRKEQTETAKENVADDSEIELPFDDDNYLD